MDPLGVALDVVEINTLKRWNEIAPLELLQPSLPPFTSSEEEEEEEKEENNSEKKKNKKKIVIKKSPFPFDEEINKKIVLWFGDLVTLNAQAIVHSTNESLNDRNPVSDRVMARGGAKLKEEITSSIKICKTGDVKISKGYNLPARYVIHTVGPKFNEKYETAAEGALYSCYRKTLQLAREWKIQSIAFTVIHSRRRGYPPIKGAHIALRTVRRFLEKFGDSFDTVVFAVEDDDIGTYEQLMPLYFPRSLVEELCVLNRLPENIGNEDGEPTNPDRQIRIIDNPHHKTNMEESIDLLDTDKVGKTEFAKMSLGVEEQRQRSSSTQSECLTLEMQRKLRYERLLRRSRTEDLSEISGIGCLYQSGHDKMGRPVIVFVGKWFKFNEINLDKALLYLIHLLDSVVKQDYIIIYFHTLTTSENHPSMAWIRDIYSVLEYKYKKNLKAFYIVHPTFWTKLMCWWFTTFMASAMKNKLQSIGGIEYLYAIMDPNQLEIPCFITEHDMTVNGLRYYAPSSSKEQ